MPLTDRQFEQYQTDGYVVDDDLSEAEVSGLKMRLQEYVRGDREAEGFERMLEPPGVGSAKKFHQDAAYYPIHPMDHVTVWVALDGATTENGCMQVVPGAHTDGMLEHEAEAYDTDITVAERDYDESDTEALPMDPGDALFQHCLLPHYTAPNESDRWRRAMIVAYMRSRSRFSTDDRPEWVDSLAVAGEAFPGCV